jgi:hypothetical protein
MPARHRGAGANVGVGWLSVTMVAEWSCGVCQSSMDSGHWVEVMEPTEERTEVQLAEFEAGRKSLS